MPSAGIEARLSSVLAHLADIITVIDERGNMLYVSPNIEEAVGRRPEERVGKSIFEYLHPDDVGFATERLAHALRIPGFSEPFEVRIQHADGTYRVFEVSANNQLANPELCGVILNSRDVTDRQQIETRLRESEMRFTRVFETAAVGMSIVDLEGRFTRVNKAYCDILGFHPADIVGKTIYDVSHPDDIERTVVEFGRLKNCEQQEYSFDKRLRRANGDWVWVRMTASIVLGSEGDPLYAIGHVVDISELRALTDRLVHQATHDELTGVASRSLLDEHLTHWLARCRRSGESLAVLFVDLDDFKVVNDQFGHGAGDEVLVEVARRLSGLVRESDLVARLGGDEFVCVLSNLNRTGDATDVAKRVIDSLAIPFAIGDAEVSVGASIGVTFYRDGNDDAGSLIARADDAVYRAKREGKRRFTFVDA